MKNIHNRFEGKRKIFPTLLASLLIVSSLFFTSGFASYASADEVVAPAEQTLTQVESTPTDVVAPETPVVSEEPATPIIEEATPVVEEVVAPTEEQAPVPAPEPTPVVVTVPATLSTEKDDYHPGQTATIFGKFFAPLQTFLLKIFGSDKDNENYTESTQTVTTDETGSFTATYTLDSLFRPFYEMVASDFNGTQLASGWFRDSAVSVYNQCSNDDGDGYASGDQGCRWINGALNPQNSAYQEGDSTVQRVLVEGLAPGSHTITFQYGTTKGGKHAYDYLTSATTSEVWINEQDLCQGMSNCVGTTEVYANIPPDPAVPPAVPQVAGRQFAIRGAIDNATVSIPVNASGSYAGDSETEVIVTFEVPQNGPMCNVTNKGTFCSVAMWFGAHVAQTTEWFAYNGTTGAGGINGAPYHVAITRLDNTSIGQRDNQMQADTIIPASTITIRKVTTNQDTATSFTFNTTGAGYTGFSLAGGAQNSQSVIGTGNFSVTEVVPSTWANTNISCTASGTGSSATPNLANNSVAITIGSAGGAVIDCTYTNALQTGNIVIVKDAVPNDAQDFVFTNNFGNGNPDTFSLDDDADVTLSNSRNSQVIAGTYSVSEDVVDGWIQTSATCSDGSPVNAVVVSAGETVTCTFTNTKKGHLIVEKTTLPAGDTTSFSITASGTGTITGGGAGSITDATDKDYEVTPGTYSVSETVPTGWVQTSNTCTNVTVAAGETKTCTITNTKQANLTIVKTTVGGNGSFSFTTTGLSPASPTITTVSGTGSQVYANIAPGTYSAAETVPEGWDLTNTVCSDGSAVDNIVLTAGESVTCTFTNTKKGSIVIEKQTLPDGSAQTFAFTGEISASLSDGQTSSKEVVPGTYTVTESALNGWDLSNLSCNDTNSTINVGTRTATFNVEAGETVKCTFTNTQRGHVIIKKNAIPDNNTQAFTFTNNFGNGNPATFDLTDTTGDGLPSYDAEVLPGTYAVSEGVVAGWKQNGAVCDLGETADSIDVGPGEVVTCIFTNTKLAKITLIKNTIGGDGTFDFVMTGNTLPLSAQLTTLAGTANQVFTNIDPDNTYSISETTQTGWVNTSATCSNGDPVTTITPNAGEEITCTFTNNKPDAKISLSPLTATNKIGDEHVVEVNVQVQNGNGVWGPAVDGTLVSFSLINTNGATAAFVPGGADTCTTTAGTCSITINSATTGTVGIHASSTPVVLTLPLHVETGVGANNSTDAQKDYVNAKIAIAATETNPVGQSHTFTVTVTKDTGSGFNGIAGVKPTVIFTPVDPGFITDNCATAGTNANGECTVVINSSVAGIFTASASANVTVNTVPFTLTTNGKNGNSVAAVKTYVDAKISIGQDGVNEVGDPHTFTGHVQVNPGTGLVNAPAGTVISFTIADGPGSLSASSCTTTDTTGTCSITLTSNVVGTTVVNASVDDISVGGLLLDRTTNGTADNSGPATKKWVDAYITIGESATNNITDPHTFTITVTQIPGSAIPASTVSITPNVTPAPSSQSDTCGPNVVFTGNTATCTFTINNNIPGVFEAGASATLSIGGASLTRSTDGVGSNSGPATKTYVAGALEITKVIAGLASVVNKESVNDTFTVTVTGPSYPAGHNITFNLVNGVLQTPAAVGLSNLIPGPYTITEADAGTEWTEVVATSPVVVTASATSTVTVTNTYVPGSLDVTKSAVLTGYQFASSADQVFTINVTGPSYPIATPLTFTLTDGVLAPATQSLTNLIPGSYTVTEVDPGVAWTVSGNGSVTVVSGQAATKTITNTVKIPNTTITMTPSVWETTSGGNVTLTITDTNDGQVPISSPTVELLANGVVTTAPTYVSGDTNTNGIMDVSETWTWTWTGTIAVNTEFTVNGIGTDPLGNPVNGPTYTSETTKLTVKVIGATRTIGFWQTHTDFTSKIFNNYLVDKFVGENIDVVEGVTHKGKITNAGQLFGGFYAPIAKTTTGTKRSQIDQARIQMLQQLLAAKLNCAAFGCSQATIDLIAQADAAYKAGTNKNLIISLAGELDAFNNSGDNVAMNPSLPATGKATPKTSQSIANTAFWNRP